MCIQIHFYLFIIVIYFYAVHKLNVFLLYYFFVFIHEIVHVIVAVFLGIKVRVIELLPVGVCAKYDYIEKRWKEVIIAAAGPLFSMILCIILQDDLLKQINFAITILNFIPIYPLDGGRIIRGVVEMAFGYKKSIIVTNEISKILLFVLVLLGVILAVYLHNFSLIIVDGYIYCLIREELKKEKIRKTINALIESNE